MLFEVCLDLQAFFMRSLVFRLILASVGHYSLSDHGKVFLLGNLVLLLLAYHILLAKCGSFSNKLLLLVKLTVQNLCW